MVGLVLVLALVVFLYRDAVRWAVRTDLRGKTATEQMWKKLTDYANGLGEIKPDMPKPEAPKPPASPPPQNRGFLGCIFCGSPSVDGRYCKAHL